MGLGFCSHWRWWCLKGLGVLILVAIKKLVKTQYSPVPLQLLFHLLSHEVHMEQEHLL